MEKKNNLVKSIFYIFFAVCFLSFGIMISNKDNLNSYVVAENVSEEEIDNQNIPSYFSAKDYIETVENDEVVITENVNSLISSDTFMFFKDGNSSNFLSLSLLTNGSELQPQNEIYNYVYYPDLTNTSVFYYYSINSISLYINGAYKEINMGDYIKSSGFSFANNASAQLEEFEMIFKALPDGGEEAMESNEIAITDDAGNVIEGIYNLSLTITLYTCTDGGTNADEAMFTDQNVTIDYSFYVVDQESYFINNRPNVTYNSFDHTVNVSSLTNPNYAYYLYSNYSSETTANKIPYIEYDYTKFELAINKTLSNTTYTSSLLYDKDETSELPVFVEGDNIVNVKVNTDTKICRVYFKDVGNYELTLSAIQIVDYTTGTGTTEIKKYALDGVSGQTKKIMVYMYGYQTNYTDLDQPTDENNIRPVSELKEYDFENGLFKNSADITSSFLASNGDYSQSTGNTTFNITNVLNYINTNDITPVKTNQTPIKLSVNAKLATSVNSYIYSTTKVSNAYDDSRDYGSITTGSTSEKLYRSTFSGRTDSTAGKYIYIIGYTFDNYYLTETTLSANTVFYQVFYFEIVKDLPTIEIVTTEGNVNVPSDTYVNQNVNIIDSTKNDPYNKDVTVQIYAYDYSNNSYLSGFGGEQGISFDSLLPSDSNENFITLEKSAHYTVRLYYTNEITSSNILYSSKSGFFREQTFTIDKNPLENIQARNVTEITNSTNYKIVSTLSDFTTNQSIVFSWNEKASGARTYAYYRYFPIIEEQYYSNREATLSTTLDRMLNYSRDASYLPVNNLLNMSTTNNNWLPYQGNTVDFTTTVSTEYVLSDAGLYLIDVYDEAGNHTVDVFMIDNTTPYFAIYDGESYKLTSSSVYVTTPSTLYWSKNKAIFIVNFRTLSYNSTINPGNITTEDLKYDGKNYYEFYLTYDGKTPCTDIFKVMYNKLFAKDYMQVLNCTVSISSATDGTSSYITGYSGMYITIPINSVSYFLDNEHPEYTQQTDVYSQAITVNEENTYRVLIRDLSNTKKDLAYSDTYVTQYTNYYSARQTIIISFDSSEFFIEFTNSDGEVEVLTSNNVVEGTISNEDNTEQRKTKTTYLSPTSMRKAFTLSFLPTITSEDMLIQVDNVVIKYYPYIESTITVGDITYHYYTLSNNATEIKVYDFEENGTMTDVKQDEIRLNSENITTAGKYEIVRTYYTEDGYSYNENDFYQRTYVFYVDRNEVVSNAELVNDENGSHLESLVGGDVFVSMYDNGTNASLVVTFPDSEKGNSNGSSIYNNGTVRSVLTTNLLPVYVYVPQYKYTTYTNKYTTLSTATTLYTNEDLSVSADINLAPETTIAIMSISDKSAKIVYNNNLYYISNSAITNYEFGVNYSSYYILTSDALLYTDETLRSATTTTLPSGTVITVDQITSVSTKITYNGNTYYINNSTYEKVDNDNYYYGTNQIKEYALYAEIYKDGTDVSNLIAITSTNSSNPTIDTIVADDSGFLNFYNYSDGSRLQYLSEEGTYYVTIYQGRFGTEVGDNNYQQSLTFSFEIKESNPDFIAQSITGSSLNSVVTSPAPSDETKPSVTYYTNQSTVSLLWDAGSTYMAEIDIDEIVFKTSKGQSFKATDDVFTQEPTLSNNQYIAQIDLKKLNVYENDGYVDITMQYKNHDSRFYSKVTKRIYVDLSAPNTNIQNLVNNSTSGNLIAGLTNSALRTYYTAEMEQTSSLTNTSYNTSNNTGTFAYYSYSVTNSYLQTLKNSLSSEVYKTYVREFTDAQGNNTKYTTEAEQETSPTDFLASNFTDLTTLTEFKPNTYYEIIETDLAGNMTIYTIFITSYTSIDDENNDYNNLITYTDADGVEHYYTIEDYLLTQSYTNATHNIYAKTGFALDNINFFGDAWAQIKLDTVNASGNTTTRYLMLTPWDRDYAYAFVGQTYTKIAISDLIDGSTSSRYKNCLSVYNRENRSTTNFYINIRNTSLTANLTDNQNREYIRFSKPTDQSIQNTIYSSTYVTSLSIKANNELIFSQTNKLGFASLWLSNSNVTVISDDTLGTITFEINASLGFVSNTRIEYEYTDNYGTTYKEIHLYKETLISQEVTSQQDLYSYYDTNGGRLYYITKDGLQYNYNPSKYTVSVYDLIDGTVSDALTKATSTVSQNSQGISTVTIKTNDETGNYNDSFAIVVRDFNNNNPETNLVKTIYFTLYNELPQANETTANNEPGQFKILDANGNNITKNIIENIVDDETGYFSEIRIIYSQKETFIPIKYSISTDKVTWTEVTSGTRLKCDTEEMQTYYLKIWYDETYLRNEMGTPEYVFGYVPDGGEDSQIFEFNLSSLTSTYWVEKTIDGVTTVVDKSDTVYTAPNGEQYANHYIVNLSYSDKDYVTIKTNKEQEITATLVDTYTQNSPVISEFWIISNTGSGDLGNIPPFNIKIIITYIPNSDNFVEEFYTYNMNGIIDTTENLVNVTSKSIVISEDYASINRIELQWSKYYGIPENEINIRLIKDGIELTPVVYTRKTNGKEYNYVYLTHSGKYSIALYDNAGNVQKFNRGNAGQTEALSFIFLKDVPFTITYTNPVTNEEETSLPIKQAIYNGNVTVNIDKNTRSEFYSLDGYPVISVKKDGVEYTEYFQDDTSYLFSEPGYYEISFTATSNLPDVGQIRQESYQFTILNPNEYRYSYVYNRYSNYYVEKVIKDGVDVTEDLLKTLDVSTITVNQKTYMTELPLSYLDEKTGAGTYLITINSNDKMFKDSSAITSWTYKVNIQVGTAPIRISVAEGTETTSNISVTFNQANIFNEMGESTIRILRVVDDRESTYYTLDINSESTGEITTNIDTAGTYYIQIVSPSGNLLYSYKVVKNDPLNAAAIIAIVISVIVVIAVIFIIIKLRKRIAVK